LDALARFDGNDGEDSDAMGAYTQAEHAGEETWVHIPRDRWPAHWHGKYTRPVCRLRLNLYGHPLAGLFWEKHCRKALLECGFEPVTGWECLYKHTEEKLFLSVYVDDFKMAGNKANLAKMWKKLGTLLELEPPTPFDENVYLGCGQQNIEAPSQLTKEKLELFDTLFKDKVSDESGGKPLPGGNLSDTSTKCTERG
jgi:hypothetical protein